MLTTNKMPFSTTALVGLTEQERTIQNEICENLGRKYLMQILILKEGDKIVFTKPRWCSWDAVLTRADGSIFVIEIKLRRCNTDSHHTFIQEIFKYNTCMNEANRLKGTYIYVNFFEDSKALIWNCNKLRKNIDFFLDQTITYNEGQARPTNKLRMYLYKNIAIKKDYIIDDYITN